MRRKFKTAESETSSPPTATPSASSSTMRATSSLWQLGLRLTLFTRANCSLCDDAKGVLERMGNHRRFQYAEIDVMASGNGKWKALYEFDTPVVCYRPNTKRSRVVIVDGPLRYTLIRREDSTRATKARAQLLKPKNSCTASPKHRVMDEVERNKAG
ncbi:hypothetical protein LTR74_005418 [Friedmanniomyces endolithicus]|nr:hypothetical protein LTR74_005418 [Friedmanniomyces endolithicus]